MAWSAKDYAVVVKAIGSVESNMTWNAINFNDPITVGIAQWFGVRAAGLLGRIRSENPSSWSGVSASLTSDLDNNSASSSYWNSRYLTQAEGSSLRPVLNNNRDIQTAQFSSDIEGYVQTARNWGMDPDNNKKAVQFFCTMYHQAPARTLDVINAIGTSPSLTQIYNGALANPVLGQYRSRQAECFKIINAGDSSGVPTGEDSPGGGGNTPPPVDNDTDPGATSDSVSRIAVSGDNLLVYFGDSTPVMAYPNGSGLWIPRENRLGGEYPDHENPDPDPDPDPDPEPGPGGWHDPLEYIHCNQAYGTTQWTSYHSGIDLAAQQRGTPGDALLAVHGGKVVRTGRHNQVLAYNSGYGVILDIGTHGGDRMYVYYGHMNTIDVEQGQNVTAGQKIGTMGGTGANHSNTDFPVHLHIVVFKNRTVNPNGATVVGRTHTLDVETYLKSKGLLQGMNACPR